MMIQSENASSTANPLWGGRFQSGPNQLLVDINSSIAFDQRLAPQDIEGSIAHARMLAACNIITEQEGTVIEHGLLQIRDQIMQGQFEFQKELEDIHMNIEHRLFELIGEPARRLHTARSRNDQVAVDMRLWVRGEVDSLSQELKHLVQTIVDVAADSSHVVMPGFTHMQGAQPVTLGHHLLAYGEMFWRDRTRLADLRVRMNECPLGSAALAGTTYPIDRDFTSRQLGFSGGPCRNSIDAVSDRDFILEFMSVSSILAVHLSRLGEEIVTWCTSQFGFAQVAEDLSAGSSIMPQKRNPDAAELLRAKSGRVIGHLVSLHTVMKGLPMAYSRDMQEDKESAFDVADTVRLCVRVADRLLGTLTFNPTRMRSEAARSNSVATDLADWLVTFRQMPFRDAHHIVGRVVQRLESEGLDLATVSLLRLAEMEPQLSGLSPQLLTPENAVAARTSFGGTAPANVRSQAIRLGELNSSL